MVHEIKISFLFHILPGKVGSFFLFFLCTTVEEEEEEEET
jgi:hypothetical protein